MGMQSEEAPTMKQNIAPTIAVTTCMWSQLAVNNCRIYDTRYGYMLLFIWIYFSRNCQKTVLCIEK